MWENTNSNHAGMKYLCNKLEELFPHNYKAIEYKKYRIKRIKKNKIPGSSILNKLFYIIQKCIINVKVRVKYINLFRTFNLDSNDTVLLMEYMDPSVHQDIIAKIVRKKHHDTTICGVSHYVPEILESLFDYNKLWKWINLTDCIITFGSSLTKYFLLKNINSSKLFTSFHYVDDYYLQQNITTGDFKVLAQGNMMRDLDSLRDIIINTPDVKFIICQGVRDLSKQFGQFSNVDLKPFMSEDELKSLMKECPVSLNVMRDTIGSNVITTSMGMGQAMICSDVGSIRDYCDETNTMFCQTIEEFSNSIRYLKNNPIILNNMRSASIKKAKEFCINNFSANLLNAISMIRQSRSK